MGLNFEATTKSVLKLCSQWYNFYFQKQLLRKLSVVLNVDDKNVVLEQIRQAGYGNGIVLLFYVIDPVLATKMDGSVVANLLKQKIGYRGTLFEYKMLRVEPYSKLKVYLVFIPAYF